MLPVLLPHRYKYVGGQGWEYLETSIIEFLYMSLAAYRLYLPRPLSSSKLVCTAEDRKEMRRKIKDIFFYNGARRGEHLSVVTRK